LHLLKAYLKAAGDPDWRFLTTATISAASGVPVGVGTRMPRVRAVFERRVKWKKLDDPDGSPGSKDNYVSAVQHSEAWGPPPPLRSWWLPAPQWRSQLW
jgi:hypothetical protein